MFACCWLVINFLISWFQSSVFLSVASLWAGNCSIRRDNRTHCRNVRFYSFSRKSFLATKWFRVVFAWAVCISSRAVRVFPALSLRRIRPSYGTFFLMVFRGNCPQGGTCHMMKFLISFIRWAHLWDIIRRLKVRSFHWNRTYTEIFLKLCQLIFYVIGT